MPTIDYCRKLQLQKITKIVQNYNYCTTIFKKLTKSHALYKTMEIVKID